MSKTPAEIVIEKLGGHQAVADILRCDLSRVYRWTYPIDRGGTGGSIPQKHQTALLIAARDRDILLEPADFFPAPHDGERAA